MLMILSITGPDWAIANQQAALCQKLGGKPRYSAPDGELSKRYRFFDCNDLPRPKIVDRRIRSDWEMECKRTGGKVKQFSNGCVDNCTAWTDESCSEDMPMHCECGEKRCWFRNTCVDNPQWYKKFKQTEEM